MKILHTCLSRSWGGMEMYALQTVEQLVKRNVHAELLCYKDSKLYYEATKKGMAVIESNFKNYFHPVELLKVKKLIEERSYDLIHCGASKDLWLLVPSAKLVKKNIPIVLSKHMGSYIIKKDFLHRWIYGNISYALAISNVIANNLTDTTPLTKEKILLLHNAIDTKRFDPTKVNANKVREEFHIAENEILIGMIARFSRGKGHEEFLQAAQSLISKFTNLRFMIVGEPSKGEDIYAAEIKELASKLGIIDKTIFTGFRKDTPEVLAAMDIFVFPSHAEAFGIALAEALSMGKPSVCSNSDGVLDIAVDNVTSFLFEKQNWVSLSEKLEKLITDKELRNKFGEMARKRAVEMFDLEVFTDKLLAIYKKTINECSEK